jgi:hypothetical protein
MTSHKFKVGQNVQMIRPGYDSGRLATFRIVRHLPQERGINQYRIKSIADGGERVAIENELTAG